MEEQRHQAVPKVSHARANLFHLGIKVLWAHPSDLDGVPLAHF